MAISRFSTLVFDLDGTLLNTLHDLTASVNHALACHGLPLRGEDEVCRFVGNGVRNLMLKAVDGALEESAFEVCFANFKAHYALHSCDLTAPYEGILEMLNALDQLGYRMAVISNKIDSAVLELVARFFPGLFQVAIGDREGLQRKPAPDMAYRVADLLGVSVEEMLYVGDSEVDLEMARRANMPCLSVTWGFRTEELLTQNGAKYFVYTPNDILAWLAEHTSSMS